MSDLLPCPFCGSPGTYVWDDIEEVWIAGCTNYGCISAYDALFQGYGGFTGDIDDARRIWNRRAE